MSATPADDAQTSPAWNCGCKDTIIFAYMQIKIAFKAIFLVDGGNSRGRKRKTHPKTPRAFRGPRRAGQPRGRGTAIPDVPE